MLGESGGGDRCGSGYGSGVVEDMASAFDWLCACRKYRLRAHSQADPVQLALCLDLSDSSCTRLGSINRPTGPVSGIVRKYGQECMSLYTTPVPLIGHCICACLGTLHQGSNMGPGFERSSLPMMKSGPRQKPSRTMTGRVSCRY